MTSDEEDNHSLLIAMTHLSIVMLKEMPKSEREVRELRSIYETSFPPQEREKFSWVFELDRGQVFWLAIQNCKIVGFAVAVSISESVLFLEYIATQASYHSTGIGRQLLDRILTDSLEWFKQHIVFEVEEPSKAPYPELARRRIDFYTRWGATPIRCLQRYYMPSFVAPDQTIPMILMDYVIRGAPDLSGDLLKSTIVNIYSIEYGATVDSAHVIRLLKEVIC